MKGGNRAVLWARLAAADLLYKAIATAALIPLTGLLLRFLVSRTGSAAVADVDIALFLVTTRSGALALVLISALVLAIVALEQACLMSLVLAARRGFQLTVVDAMTHGARRAFAILRLTTLIVLRVLVLAIPFLAVLGATYATLLSRYDINYYLTGRPPAFWGAAAIVAVVVAMLAALLLRKATGWLLALPLVIFEGVLPVHAFAASERRMTGHRKAAAVSLAAWAALAIALPFAVTFSVKAIGRVTLPAFGGSVAALLLAISVVLVVWLALALAAGVIVAGSFAMRVIRFYEGSGPDERLQVPRSTPLESGILERRARLARRALLGGLAVAFVVALGMAAYVLQSLSSARPVLVIAHRGAAAEAPENTLAAFRRAVADGADLVELDVQESADGVVVVNHDKDLMKVGRSPLKVWESSAEALRAVDVGSHFSPAFKDERVPTLAEALALCKGRSRVDIELKFYGHDQRLAERVVELVEAAGMEREIVTMSLHRDMVRQMKSLRPKWRAGILSAKAIGDLTQLPADFLAVESGMASRRFVRSAHQAGKDVYVWSVNDPSRMLQLIGRGVDGIITDRPALAREVVKRYAGMTQAERLLLVMTIPLGARPEIVPPDESLRP